MINPTSVGAGRHSLASCSPIVVFVPYSGSPPYNSPCTQPDDDDGDQLVMLSGPPNDMFLDVHNFNSAEVRDKDRESMRQWLYAREKDGGGGGVIRQETSHL